MDEPKVEDFYSSSRSTSNDHLIKAQEMEKSGLTAAASREYSLFAGVCHACGNYDEAIRYYEKADSLHPISIENRLKLAQTLYQLKEYTRSAKQYQNLAEMFFEQGLTDRAIEIFSIALGTMPDSLELRLGLADLHSRSSQTQKALKEYREIINQHPENPDAHLRLADILLKRNNKEDAMQEYAHAADIFASQNLIDEAAACYHKILKIFPDYIHFRRKLIEILSTRQDSPALLEELLRLGETLWSKGERESAMHAYQRVLELDPHNKTAQMRLNETVRSSDAVRLVPEEEETATDTSGTFEPLDDIWDEISPTNADFATTSVPNDPNSSYDLGMAYMEMALIDDAIGEFQKAALNTDYRMMAANMLGLCFLEQDKPRRALRSFLRALNAPGEEEYKKIVFYNMARAYTEIGELESALDALYDIYVIDVRFSDVILKISEIERRIKSREMRNSPAAGLQNDDEVDNV